MKQRNTHLSQSVFEHTLFIVPAYNIGDKENVLLTPLNGKPLLHYALDTAQQLIPKNQICVSSNDMNIINSALNYGQNIPFKLPEELSSMEDVDIDEIVLHAIDHYARKGGTFDKAVVLSPHAPFCTAQHIKEAYALFDKNTDMVASVSPNSSKKKEKFIENKDGFLETLPDNIPVNGYDAFCYNQVFSILRTTSIRQHPRSFFRKVRKYLMEELYATMIFQSEDIRRGEHLIQEGLLMG